MSNRTVNYDPALRMIDFVLLLDQGRREWLLADMAERLGVGEKTIRRYVTALQARFRNDDEEPTVQLERRKEGTYVVARGAILSQDPSLDYASVFLATKLLDFTSDSPLKRNLDRLAGLLRNRAKGEERNALARFARKFYVHHTSRQRAPADREVTQRLITALIEEKRIEVAYHRWDTPRVVEPLCLKVVKEVLYLDVRFPNNKGSYILTVPLIEKVKLLPEAFAFPEDWFPEQANSEKFGVMQGEVIDLALVFPEQLRTYAQSRMWHGSQHNTVLQDGRVRVTMRTTLTSELVSWIASLGGQVYVESPDALRTQVKEHLEAGLKQYV